MMLYLLLLLGPLLLAIWAQVRVHSAFAEASRIPARAGMTGAEAAAAVMEAHGIRGVAIEPSHGFLSDHYDPRHKVLRLSRDVYAGRSVAALGIAAHEAGHAIQDATRYAPLVLRNGIVPLAAIGSNAGVLLMFLGLGLGGAAAITKGVYAGAGYWMFIAGIVLFSAVVLFQLINLPVEYDASRRAKDLLQSSGLVAQGEEARAMNKVLSAAALTYVAATVGSIATLLYYLLASGLLGGRSSRD
jgi:Zn-dependent membrane protease YugP